MPVEDQGPRGFEVWRSLVTPTCPVPREDFPDLQGILECCVAFRSRPVSLRKTRNLSQIPGCCFCSTLEEPGQQGGAGLCVRCSQAGPPSPQPLAALPTHPVSVSLAPRANQLAKFIPYLVRLPRHSDPPPLLFIQTNVSYPSTVLRSWGIRQRCPCPLGSGIQECGVNNQLVTQWLAYLQFCKDWKVAETGHTWVGVGSPDRKWGIRKCFSQGEDEMAGCRERARGTVWGQRGKQGPILRALFRSGLSLERWDSFVGHRWWIICVSKSGKKGMTPMPTNFINQVEN